MLEMKKLVLVALSALILAGCSDTETATVTQTVSADAPVLRALERQGLTIHSPMAVPGGLDGFAASAGTQPLAVYVMPDANYALIGTLIDSEGKAVADEELRRLASVPIDQASWAALESARWVADGDLDAERVVYTFTDANCPFCNEMWHSARPWVEAGKVQLRHLMVGVIRADSPAKAAAILEADDPSAALIYNEVHHGEGGIDPLDSISAQTRAELERNMQLMGELGFSGTPGVIARAGDGSLIFQSGVPRGPDLERLFGPL